MKQVGTLEIEQNISFQKFFWTVERVAWAIFFIIVALSLFGFVGNGMLSDTTRHSSNLSVTYERIYRQNSPTQFLFDLKESQTLFFSQDFLQNYQIEQITPAPNSIQINKNFYIYHFSGPTKVTFNIRPQEMGVLSGKVGTNRQDLITVEQFIFP